MRRLRWAALVVVVVAAGGAAAFVALDDGGTDPLEGQVDSTLATPEALPEWTTTTVDDSSGSTITPTDSSDVDPPVATGATISGDQVDVSIYVDAADGSDDNDGLSEASPLATVTHAIGLASDLRLAGERVRIVLAAGTYRETVEVFQDPDDSPLLIIESAEPGTAIVSGADVWDGWSWSEDAEAFVHPWPFDWGSAPDVEEIVGRREIVVVDGVRLEQVTRVRDLTDGTFLVDEDSDRLLMLPPAGSSFTGLAAEVAVRERTLNLDSARNVVIRGLTFQHAANPFESSGVRISNSEQVLFENNQVVENSWTGLGLSTSEALTVRGNVINRNGGGGAGMFQITDVVFEGNDTSLNNWRGAKGDYVGWSIAGVKAVGVQRVAFIQHRAWWNATRGLWLDYDVRDITVTDSSWCHNLTDGLFVEAAPGPVRIDGVEACENGRYGLLLVNVYGASIIGSAVCGNADSQIHMNAEPGGREIVTDDGTLVMTASRDLVLQGNRVVGAGRLLEVSIPQTDFAQMVATLESADNVWVSSDDEDAPFDFPGGSGTLETWQAETGADLGSSWERALEEDSCAVVGS